jgi:hypothetical protein
MTILLDTELYVYVYYIRGYVSQYDLHSLSLNCMTISHQQRVKIEKCG